MKLNFALLAAVLLASGIAGSINTDGSFNAITTTDSNGKITGVKWDVSGAISVQVGGTVFDVQGVSKGSLYYENGVLKMRGFANADSFCVVDQHGQIVSGDGFVVGQATLSSKALTAAGKAGGYVDSPIGEGCGVTAGSITVNNLNQLVDQAGKVFYILRKINSINGVDISTVLAGNGGDLSSALGSAFNNGMITNILNGNITNPLNSTISPSPVPVTGHNGGSGGNGGSTDPTSDSAKIEMLFGSILAAVVILQLAF